MLINYKHLKSDLKQISREPIIFILYFAPLLLFIFLLIALHYLPIFIDQYFDLMDYISYILAGTLSLTSGLLGIATGFMMIDDKDGKIYELMQITPLGRKGYLLNRLLIPCMMAVFYASIFIYFIHPLSFIQSIFLIIMCFIESALFAIALFHLADDQVKGLTYAKGLNIIILFAFTRLIRNDFISLLAFIIPTYWLTEAIRFNDLYILTTAVIIHLIWLLAFFYSFTHRKS
jgi:fluoroquinolone transport system permease protein